MNNLHKYLVLILVVFLYATSTNAKLNPVNNQFNRQYDETQTQQELPKYLGGRILVKYKENTPFLTQTKGKQLSSLQDKFESTISSITEPFALYFDDKFEDLHGISRIYEVEFSNAVDAFDFAKKMNLDPNVEYAEPIYERYFNDFVPNDPGYSTQWAPQKIGMEQAWEITKGSEDILIAIVDSGTFIDHEDLAANVWENPDETLNGLDDDGNGKIDDIHGWDFVGNYTGSNGFREDNNPQPSSTGVSHGTHVAGCAAAVGDNGIGMAGPAFNCKFVAVKVGSDNPGVRGLYKGYEGILYAAKLGADIINCSWGGPGFSQTEQDIINQANSFGTTIIVAAGNDGKNLAYFAQYPAQLDNVLSIGSSASNDKRSSFSNYGWQNCVYAPGSRIYATLPGNRYGKQDGTSMASPVASGVAALVKTLHPDWNFKQIYHQLRSTSDNVFAGDNEEQRLLFYGRINANKALLYNNGNSKYMIPGVSVNNMLIGNEKPLLTKIGKYQLDVKLTNYLAATNLLKVTFTPMENFIKISNNDFEIKDFQTLTENSINLNIELTGDNPWFDGSAKILVKYESQGYVDFEVLKIPIKLQSTNQYQSLQYIPDNLYPQWFGTDSPEKGSFWAVGYSPSYRRGLFVIIGDQINFNVTGKQEQLSCVHAIDKTSAFVGTGNGEILKTSTMGNTFTRTNVSSIVSFINDINFFNDKYGVFIGDPHNGNKFAIGYTTNNGASWKLISQQPASASEEAGLVGASFWKDDLGWFGTTAGRIFRSIDRGQSWKPAIVASGNTITGMAFGTETDGIAMYGIPSNSKTLIASTKNGGASWTSNVFDFGKLGQLPIHAFSTDSTDDIFIITHENRLYRTSDIGRTWTPVISFQTTPLKTAGHFVEGENARLWSISNIVGRTDCFIGEPNKEIEILTDKDVIYDSTAIDKTDKLSIRIKNTGNVILNIGEILIENDNEENTFSLFLEPDSELFPDKTLSIRTLFKPVSEGMKTGKLTIKTEIADFEFNLSGYAYDAASVEELAILGITNLLVSPNPSSITPKLSFTSDKLLNMQLSIFNLNGIMIDNKEYSSNIGNNNIVLSNKNLEIGSYYLHINTGSSTSIVKFMINR